MVKKMTKGRILFRHQAEIALRSSVSKGDYIPFLCPLCQSWATAYKDSDGKHHAHCQVCKSSLSPPPKPRRKLALCRKKPADNQSSLQSRRKRIDWDYAEKLYNDGLSDKKIAKVLNCTAGSVFQWRKRTSKMPNYLPNPKKNPVSEEVYQ